MHIKYAIIRYKMQSKIPEVINMPRFFMAGSTIAGGSSILITGADAEHAKVLRLRVGDRIIVCDGEKTDHHCTIKKIAPDEARKLILSRWHRTLADTVSAYLELRLRDLHAVQRLAVDRVRLAPDRVADARRRHQVALVRRVDEHLAAILLAALG